jgi:ABC-type hemin transport system substrate-binding protein
MLGSTLKFGIGAVAAFMLAVACGRETGESDEAKAPSPPPQTLRIVSLSPAISRTLQDFSLQNQVVGRTQFCDAVDAGVAIVGDLGSIDFERLVRLEPTHILLQPPAAGINPALSELVRQRGWVLGSWRLNTIDDIETMVRELPETLAPRDASSREQKTQRAAEILNEIALSLTPGPGPQPLLRVLMLSDVDPPLAFGTGTYLHDILIALGGVNAIADAGWVQLSIEDAVRLRPDAILLVKPGAPPATATNAVMDQLGPLASADTPAVRERRVAVLVDPDALLPSSAVVQVAKELRAKLRELTKAQEP